MKILMMIEEEKENTPRRNHNRENLRRDLRKWELAVESGAKIVVKSF